MLSVKELQNHIADLRKDLASAVKRARVFSAHAESAVRNEAKGTVVALRKQIKGLTRFKKLVAERDSKRK